MGHEARMASDLKFNPNSGQILHKNYRILTNTHTRSCSLALLVSLLLISVMTPFSAEITVPNAPTLESNLQIELWSASITIVAGFPESREAELSVTTLGVVVNGKSEIDVVWREAYVLVRCCDTHFTTFCEAAKRWIWFETKERLLVPDRVRIE
jgi:hypothetical protein